MASLLSKLSLKPGDNCLDVGCGTGNLTAKIAEKVEPNGLVIGYDLDRRRINIAKKNNLCRNIKFYEGHLAEIELAENFFNIAISNLVYHWMDKDEQQRRTEKVFSVLKSNGTFALFIEKDNPQNVGKIIPYLPEETQQRLRHTLFFFTEEYYRDLFTNTGFEIVLFESVKFEFPLDSLDSFLHLLDVTYATEEFTTAYYHNKEKITICHLADGTLCSPTDTLCLVLKKP